MKLAEARTFERCGEVVVDETPSGVSNSMPPAVLEAEGTGPGSHLVARRQAQPIWPCKFYMSPISVNGCEVSDTTVSLQGHG